MSRNVMDLILIRPEKNVDGNTNLVRLDKGHLRQIVNSKDILNIGLPPIIVEVRNINGRTCASSVNFYEDGRLKEVVPPKEAEGLVLGNEYIFNDRAVRPASYCILKDKPDDS